MQVYLGALYAEVLRWDTFAHGGGSTVARVIDGSLDGHTLTGMAGVANVGAAGLRAAASATATRSRSTPTNRLTCTSGVNRRVRRRRREHPDCEAKLAKRCDRHSLGQLPAGAGYFS